MSSGGAYGIGNPFTDSGTDPVFPRITPTAPSPPRYRPGDGIIQRPPVAAVPLVVQSHSRTAPPPAATASSFSHANLNRTKWVALSLVLTSLVALIITVYLSGNLKLGRGLCVGFSFLTAASAALILGAAIKTARSKNAAEKLTAQKVGWVGCALLATAIIALLVIGAVRKNPYQAQRIFYPTFGIIGGAGLVTYVVASISARKRPVALS